MHILAHPFLSRTENFKFNASTLDISRKGVYTYIRERKKDNARINLLTEGAERGEPDREEGVVTVCTSAAPAHRVCIAVHTLSHSQSLENMI